VGGAQQSGADVSDGAPPAPRYSFVVPIYRDEDLAEEFCVAFDSAMREYTGEENLERVAELIFVQDGGSAEESASLRETCDRHPVAKMITLSRNFGQHIAISCGYRHASGERVGMMNVDQEDPPDQIPLLLDALERSDADIAYSLRRNRSASALVKHSSRAFNWLLNKATGSDAPLDVGTLRVMKRRGADLINDLPERGRYLPGLEHWLGLRGVFVEIENRPRERGRSSYSMRRRLRMAFEAIIAYSDLPLRLVVMVGAVIAFLGFLLTAFLIVAKLVSDGYQPGYTSTMAAVVFMGGVQICVIGLASIYIGRVLTESQRRPLYVVRERHKL
jgi:dolichol-phosphate mannosyltransferase